MLSANSCTAVLHLSCDFGEHKPEDGGDFLVEMSWWCLWLRQATAPPVCWVPGRQAVRKRKLHFCNLVNTEAILKKKLKLKEH